MIFRKKMAEDREDDPDRDHAQEVDWGVLAPREMEVVRLMGEGWWYREIGERMGIATQTVFSYAYNAAKKLKLKGLPALRQAAVRWVDSSTTN